MHRALSSARVSSRLFSLLTGKKIRKHKKSFGKQVKH
jgi:hypothetical protein